MQTGKVKWFNADKGFGFIFQEDGPDVFVHHSVIDQEGYRFLEENDDVEFELNPNPKKGLAASMARKIRK